MNKIIDICHNVIITKICGEQCIFDISYSKVPTSEFREIRVLEDDFKYYINTRTGEKIAIYKEGV